MLSNKEFFEQLREGEEYLSCLMSKETYSGIDFEMREMMLLGDIRRKNSELKHDEHHKKLISNISKAKRDLVIYENGMKFDSNK